MPTATRTDHNVSATGSNNDTSQEGSATLTNIVLATFSDQGNPPPRSHTVSPYTTLFRSWGDGQTSAGTITNNNNGTWTVTGSHTYVGDTVNSESEGTADIGGAHI